MSPHFLIFILLYYIYFYVIVMYCSNFYFMKLIHKIQETYDDQEALVVEVGNSHAPYILQLYVEYSIYCVFFLFCFYTDS